MKSGHTVLVVDDDVQVGKIIAALLKKISVNSVYASSGAEALYKIENIKNPFSLIISDQRMPKMKGTELLEKVGQISPDTVRFLATGYSDINAIIQAVNRGKIHKYISKPWQSEQLLEDIRGGLKQYELNAEYEELYRIAKEQNAKLYNLNKMLKQNAEKQSNVLANLEQKLRALHGSSNSYMQAFDGAGMSDCLSHIKNELTSRDIKEDEKLNQLLAAVVAELYCRFQEVAFKNGFEISAYSSEF